MDSKPWSSDDWYRDGESQLHFFPRQKRLVFTNGKRIVAEAAAWGGVAFEHWNPAQGMRPQPTTPGTYVIAKYEPYVTKTWKYSRIPWGTPLALDPSGEYVLYKGGTGTNRWLRLDRLMPGMNAEQVRSRYRDLYGSNLRINDSNGDGIPDTWVFGDFGPYAVRYFRDRNRNRKLDAGESLMGEMIHTTPENEAQTAQKQPVQLEDSHGCIHVKPVDRDRFLRLRAFTPGYLLVVHAPSEVVPEFLSRSE